MFKQGEYKILSIGLQQETPNHVPYPIFGIVEGPKGGKILLDSYNLDRLFAIASNHSIQVRISSYLASFANRTGIATTVSLIGDPEIAVVKYGESIGIPQSRMVIRLNNQRLFEKVAKGFWFYDPAFEYCAR